MTNFILSIPRITFQFPLPPFENTFKIIKHLHFSVLTDPSPGSILIVIQNS
jgi:hypothetical protein